MANKVEAEDNWADKSTFVCVTCMWYKPKEMLESTGQPIGRCRAHPPDIRGFPIVYATDYCGQHRMGNRP